MYGVYLFIYLTPPSGTLGERQNWTTIRMRENAPTAAVLICNAFRLAALSD